MVKQKQVKIASDIAKITGSDTVNFKSGSPLKFDAIVLATGEIQVGERERQKNMDTEKLRPKKRNLLEKHTVTEKHRLRDTENETKRERERERERRERKITTKKGSNTDSGYHPSFEAVTGEKWTWETQLERESEGLFYAGTQ